MTRKKPYFIDENGIRRRGLILWDRCRWCGQDLREMRRIGNRNVKFCSPKCRVAVAKEMRKLKKLRAVNPRITGILYRNYSPRPKEIGYTIDPT